ncbi:MAG: sulfatase, partial [Verrucomicrobiota bacterium]
MSALAAGAARPNFLFFLCDDLGWADVGYNGSTFHETPHIDRLAASGMKFNAGYAACSVCSPTRASIMTGKYPARLRLTNFIYGRRGGKLVPPEFEKQMALEEVTIAEALKEQGYTTFFSGKWHLGERQFHPDFQGFDVSVCNGPGGPYKGYQNWRNIRKDPLAVGGYFSPYGNPHLPDGPPGEYLTDRLTDEAIDFMKVNREKPFFAYVSYHSVHNPLQARKEDVAYFKKKLERMPKHEGPEFITEWKSKCRQVQRHPVYAGMIKSIDDNVGKAVAALKELELADRTVVIFMSDNGGLSTSEGHNTSNLPLRGGKGWSYEGGVREPMIVHWPGVTGPGSETDEPVISTDFYPTMLEIAGAPLKPEQHLDGVSFVPLLKGEKKLTRKAIFWHYPHYSNQGGHPSSAVREGDYKLIEHFEDGSVELYNLKEDLGERNDLSEQMPELAARLKQSLEAWRK